MAVFALIMKYNLTLNELKRAISSLMFLKENRDKTAKEQFCADGRGQREDWAKQETTLPTVSNESVFLTSVVEAPTKEGTLPVTTSREPFYTPTVMRI